MTNNISIKQGKPPLRFELIRQRRKVWFISGLACLISAIGIVVCLLDPEIRAPLRPGLDFTGGTQIKLERYCQAKCTQLNTETISDIILKTSLPVRVNVQPPNLSGSRVKLLDDSKSLVIRLPFLSADQGQQIIDVMTPVAGPFESGGKSVDTIGPTLGSQLLRSSLISLVVAFSGIALYISLRYDRRYAFLALLAVAHDVIIVCGVFAWLGYFYSLEVDSLFAVALLTIAGYSVNDTVVVFDRIREKNKEDSSKTLSEQIDLAVSATLTRTLYTSATTLLPLLTLMFFGGSTLFWFAFALSLGVVVGSWSSISLAPSLLSLARVNHSKMKG